MGFPCRARSAWRERDARVPATVHPTPDAKTQLEHQVVGEARLAREAHGDGGGCRHPGQREQRKQANEEREAVMTEAARQQVGLRESIARVSQHPQAKPVDSTAEHMQVSRRKPKRRYFEVLQEPEWGSTEKDFHYSEVRFCKAENPRHPPTVERGRSGGQDGPPSGVAQIGQEPDAICFSSARRSDPSNPMPTRGCARSAVRVPCAYELQRPAPPPHRQRREAGGEEEDGGWLGDRASA